MLCAEASRTCLQYSTTGSQGVIVYQDWNNRPAESCLLCYHGPLEGDMGSWVRHKKCCLYNYSIRKEKRWKGFWTSSVSSSGHFLLRWLWDYSFLLSLNESFILHLEAGAECQVFSKSVSLPACHEVSGGHLLAQVKVWHANLCKKHETTCPSSTGKQKGCTSICFELNQFAIKYYCECI